MTNEFDEMLNIDPLGEAEKITGRSYKEDEETLHLGMLLQLAKNSQVSEELSLRNDTHFGISWNEALSIYEDLGFQEIFSEEFSDFLYPENPKTEVYKVFWNEGFLLAVESYNAMSTVNSASLYYNWIPHDLKNSHRFTSSGSYDENSEGELVWSGDHDAREGLRNIISNLKGHGEILETWQFSPFLWLVNFSAKKQDDYSYKRENQRVMSNFPESIQERINFRKED